MYSTQYQYESFQKYDNGTGSQYQYENFQKYDNGGYIYGDKLIVNQRLDF